MDYAYGPSHDFWTDYYRAVKRENPDSYHFGEIVETPALLRSYEGVMDGALDFLWLQAARKLFAFNSSNVAGSSNSSAVTRVTSRASITRCRPSLITTI
ncbi:MAG: hypothetical protein U0528_19955 [Anaerolineae bacterium]